MKLLELKFSISKLKTYLVGFGNIDLTWQRKKLCDNENWKINYIIDTQKEKKTCKYPLQTSVKIYKLILKHK